MGIRLMQGIVLFFALGFVPLLTAAQHINIATPNDGRFLRAGVNLVTEEDGEEIQRVADALLAEEAVPLYVVVIDSMIDHTPVPMPIQKFSRTLYEQWGRDKQFVDGAEWHNGILLVIARKDRKAHIELGRDWAGRADTSCERIMDQVIVPKCRNGDYSGALVNGVDAVAAMARGEELPEKPDHTGTYIAIAAALVLFWGGLLLLAARQRHPRRDSGDFWVTNFGPINTTAFIDSYENRVYGGHGGGHSIVDSNDYGSGFDFDGGGSSDFGGGGGATGSW